MHHIVMLLKSITDAGFLHWHMAVPLKNSRVSVPVSSHRAMKNGDGLIASHRSQPTYQNNYLASEPPPTALLMRASVSPFSRD